MRWHLWVPGEGCREASHTMDQRAACCALCSPSWWLLLSGFQLLPYSRCWGTRAHEGLREEVSRFHSFSGPKLLTPPVVRCLLFVLFFLPNQKHLGG